MFGRGGEEAEALADAGVPFEVVPGVTSAVAAPAYAGIPLTRRGTASSFTVVTGSETMDKDAVPWDVLAQAGGTLVVLMGWESLATIVATLTRAGRPADTPVALVEWGTEPYQKTVVGTLSDVAEKAAQAGLAPPVVAVIGEVVELRGKAPLVRRPSPVRRARIGDQVPDPGRRSLGAALAGGSPSPGGAHHRDSAAGRLRGAGRRPGRVARLRLGRISQRQRRGGGLRPPGRAQP